MSINCFTFLNILNISDCSDFLVSSDLSTVPQLRWLHILRVLSLYNLTQNVVRNGNVDNEDELKVLVGYKKCLVDRFKTYEEQVCAPSFFMTLPIRSES